MDSEKPNVPMSENERPSDRQKLIRLLSLLMARRWWKEQNRSGAVGKDRLCDEVDRGLENAETE